MKRKDLHDSTPTEREQLRKLRKEKKRNTGEGEYDLVMGGRGGGSYKRHQKSLHLALGVRGLTAIDKKSKNKLCK